MIAEVEGRNMVRSVCIVTGSRAEYGLLYWLIRAIAEDEAFDLRLVVTGMHLMPDLGATVGDIERDGLAIDARIDMGIAGDSPEALAAAVGRGVAGFGAYFARRRPDVVVLLGDRFELLGPAVAACLATIPIAHLEGGHVTEGAIDDAIRHAVTKLAHLHFTATEAYRKRIVQLGEAPERTFAVGATGIDAILREPRMSRPELEAALDFTLGRRSLLVTYHPATLEPLAPKAQVAEVLAALAGLDDDVHLIFTLPNADTGGKAIMAAIEAFAQARPGRAKAYASLGRRRYYSLLALVDGVVGNSSSGLIEAPSFRIGTVNIGDRQKGRLRAASVIDCPTERMAIAAAIGRLFDPGFRIALASVVNPFGDGQASARIKDVLKNHRLDDIVRKPFYDIEPALP